ncbi:SH3 domain-containing protein [Alphaproteobacteria bacterium endosymbiont of Tiliacea citrago]|uniref:SH3 domain-containing protein n=1 Tax=Alphaproteobacteria bacterium endosymbiont of Tiliacea citrago TaxID=3077944 RepID=UPI00313ED4E1
MRLYLNIFLVFMILSLFLFNKKQKIMAISENQLCSTKFEKATIYHGPNNKNIARFVLKKGYPLFVLERRKGWIKIIDPENRVGWIKKDNLSNEPRALTKNKIIIENEDMVIMPNVSVKLIKVKNNECIIEIEKKQIKLNKNDLWICP